MRSLHLPAIVSAPSHLSGLMQFMPLLAISPRFFSPLFSRFHNALLEFDGAARVLIPYQHFTFIPLLMVAKFGEITVYHWWHHPLGMLCSLKQHLLYEQPSCYNCSAFACSSGSQLLLGLCICLPS